ncbi:MAG TPA: ATP-binding cassette domain-containing protein [Candidatus Ventrousia excrementavium]|uniref:ATP-binding cassette domain-containing protein n=1 Tax=Candidatus Ventrousia excrementavium TaxID=2840961 RepID=A0A9D1LKC9_9CLOT|nr:ATP-binding cassette domain-containing protein [Candidatus Ventrousia excrementavium]
MSTENILEIRGLRKWFPVKSSHLFHGEKKYVKAVDGIDLTVRHGETLGIVGESGCGKSTLGRTILKLIPPTDGTILFDGRDITGLSDKEMRPVRRDMQIMFQDPYASLNPRMTVADIIAEPIDTMKLYQGREARLRRIVELMEVCGINKAFLNRYPHEFSGGQRQRIGIARALSVNPKLIVCDEPVSALDVSIQSQIINLLVELQKQYQLTLLFISHDLGVVEYISDRVAVMYLGKIVEIADKAELFKNPVHPYTKALLSSIPEIGGKKFEDERPALEGDIPSPVNPPSGCTFHTRCPVACDRCARDVPQLHEVSPGHFVSCLRTDENAE